jgi:plastocyanin
MTGYRVAVSRLLIGALGALSLLAGSAVRVNAAGKPPTTYTVTIEAMRFQPDSLLVKMGDRVVWVNRDPFPHTVVSSVGKFRSQEIAPGQSWGQSMKRTGVLPYACSLHPTMKAELRVN